MSVSVPCALQKALKPRPVQEELSTTLSELEQKMAVLDADLTWRAVEAEKLQVTSCK